MGIKGLTKLLADNAPNAMKEQKLESYFGRKIAVDASLSIYQFLIVVGRTGTEMLTNEAGEVTSHLQGMLSRTIRLLEAGLKPVYVFDGKPPLLKSQELVKRYSKRADATEDLNKAIEAGNQEEIEKFSKRTVKVTKQHNDDCKKLLKLMGVPVIEAPSEAEAQCAALCKADKVYAVASEDMDSLTFGAPRFLRHLMDPSSRKIPVMEFDVSKVLEELNLTMDQFIDLCILSGCDYCDSIRGIGGQTALKLIRQHGSIEKILENINKERYQIPDDWPYQEARRLFNEPAVLSDEEQLEIKWTAPDEEGLINFLVNENGFNSDRITKAIEKIKAATNKSSQGRLESFYNLTCNTSAPIKRKWILSSACSIHMTGDRALLSHFEEKVGSQVIFADGSKSLIKGYGKFESGNVIIEDVAQVEGLKQNFLSVGQFLDKGFVVRFSSGRCQITHNQTGELALSGVVKGGVYVVDLDSVEKDNLTVF